MIIDVKVPQLSESVAEATLVTWHKQIGEAVARDENLIDIETDKVVLELPASANGVLVEIIKQNGDTVVADEVRKLAERTSASTADISRTVEQIQRTTGDAVASMERAVNEVEEGIGLMKASGASFEQITANSDHVTEMAQSIASAARQQSVATESVAANMEQISVLIDENTHAARQAWAVTEELGQTANALHAIVARFRGVA